MFKGIGALPQRAKIGFVLQRHCIHDARGDGSIDVKGQGLRGEKSLILSLSCTPDLFAKGWFNQEKTLWGNLSTELFYRVETCD